MKAKIIQQNDQPVLCIRTTSNTTDLYPTVDALTEKLMDHCKNLQITPTGIVYTAYSNFDKRTFDLEVGLPTDKSYPGSEEIISTVIPEGAYVVATYQGAYKKMRSFYAQLEEWLTSKGFQSGAVNYERYLNSADQVEEEELLTEVTIPIEPI